MDDRSNDPYTLTIGGTKDSRALLRVIDHKFVIGKEEFLPHVAEMHYFRVAKRHWSVCFERIRRANFRIISTAVPWNLHEARQGDFDFSGALDPANDLIVFLELCREFGFKIMLKPGPWLGQECDGGGIPNFAVRHPDTVATGRGNEPLIGDPGAGAKTTPMPSYLSSRYHILLKNYFSMLTEVVRNYIYPRGPVFMIELDHETSFGGHFDPFSGDFNPKGSGGHFGQFLQEKYQDLGRLNKLWKAKFKEFDEIVAPESREIKTENDYMHLLDWVEYREWVINRYCDTLTELMSQTEVSVLFARSLAYKGPYSFPNIAGARTDGRTIFTVNLNWDSPFAEMIRRARSVAAWQATGFCTSFAVGAPHPDPEVGHAYRPVTPKDTQRLFVAGLAAGIKGYNFHMFVGRERWYDGGLEADGAILPSFDVLRDVATRLPELKYETMRDFADVALVQYRPYQRVANLGVEGAYDYLVDLCGPGFDAVAADLMALAYDYRIFNLDTPNRLDKYGTVIVPSGEVMAPEAQECLAELVKGGAHLIIFGVLPSRGLDLEPCDILAKAIGFRTTPESQILAISTKRGDFSTRVYGTIKKTPSRAVKLAKADTKLVAAANKSGKGQVTLLTFSPGSLLLPDKLGFFHEILKSSKLATPVFSSDPRVHVAAHAHQKAGLWMIYDTAETLGVPENVSESASSRGVIVGLDLELLNLQLPKVVLHDVFTGDTLKVTAKDLKAGIEIRLGRGDSRLYSVERK